MSLVLEVKCIYVGLHEAGLCTGVSRERGGGRERGREAGRERERGEREGEGGRERERERVRERLYAL